MRLLFLLKIGVPEPLLTGMSIAFQAIDCPEKISHVKFDQFAQSWLDDFHSSPVSWSWLSPTVHLLFVHGSQILKKMPVSSSLLSGQITIYVVCMSQGR